MESKSVVPRVSWTEVYGNPFSKGLNHVMLAESGYVYATHARLIGNPAIKVFCQIHYDRKYVLAYLERKIVTATNSQAEFEFAECKGTLVGFWTPDYAKTINISGYHLHLLSDDHQHGGHLLNLSGSNFEVQIAYESDIKLALPESAEFLQADLTIDPSSALDKAERAK